MKFQNDFKRLYNIYYYINLVKHPTILHKNLWQRVPFWNMFT
nr:MAG TPA: hypothetical protein [Caudoviricetes sp.]